MIDFNKLKLLPLDETYHMVQGFSCGDNWVDGYLKEPSNAINDHKLGISSTTTVIYDGELVAFFTANCSLLEISVDEVKAIGLQNDVFVPSIEVKFIGVNQKFQKKGIGKYLVQYIIGQAIRITPIFTCRYIFLRSVEKRISYYREELFFEYTGTKDEHDLHLMKFLIPNYQI